MSTTVFSTSVVAIIKNFAIAIAIFESHDLHAINAFGDVTMRCDAWLVSMDVDACLVRHL